MEWFILLAFSLVLSTQSSWEVQSQAFKTCLSATQARPLAGANWHSSVVFSTATPIYCSGGSGLQCS